MARTPKARALRQAREEKHLLLRELASAISRDIGVVSRWETGDRTPKPEQVARILSTLGVNGERYEEIMTLAYGTDESQWVAMSLPERRQQMAAYVDWEQNATRIVEVAPLLIPGILQTGDFIRAMMNGSDVPDGEIASRVTARLGRSEAITKRRPADLLVLLGRAALNQNIGGKEVMIEQLQYLLEMAVRPNIELRVITDHTGWHPGLEGAFALIESKRGNATNKSIVFVGTRRSDLMLHEESDLDAYRWAIDRILEVSFQPDVSANFIADLARRMEKHNGD
jgi:transcriptional regulator with XRE-family HTH domain